MANLLNARLQRGRELYRELRLDEACLIFQKFFDENSLENHPELSEFYSLYLRTLYELGKEEELQNQRKIIQQIGEAGKSPEIGYQLAMSYLSADLDKTESSKKIFEKLLTRTEEVNLLARIKMGLATAHDILTGDWRVTSSIIDSIQQEGLEPYLTDLLGIWRAKILRDSGQLEEAEQTLVVVFSKIKSDFHWHAYLSAKVILGGIYLKQNRYESLIEVIKEVRAYCDKYQLKTITRQIDYLAEQIRGETPRASLVLEHSQNTSVLRYEDKVLSLAGEKPWQKLLVYFIREKIVPKKEIIRNLYRREYRPKRDDKLIYGQLNLLKRNLLKLGLSEKSIKKEPLGYRWIPDVAEVEGSQE